MKSKVLLFAAVATLFWMGCMGGDSSSDSDSNEPFTTNSDNSENDEPDNVADAVNQMQDALKEMNDGKEVEVVNFRDLKELLPNKIAGIPQTNTGGETTGGFGIKVSNAEGEYEEGDKRIEMNIMDTGGLGAAMMSFAAWSTIEVDREDDNGYERTTMVDGHKAFEKYEKNSGRYELAMIVDDRFRYYTERQERRYERP